MRRLLVAGLPLVALGVQAGMRLENPQNEPAARVTLTWRYKKVPARMQVFALKPGSDVELWQMSIADDLRILPLGEELSGKAIALSEGQDRMLVLVMRNATGKPIRFFAAPHAVKPAERSLGCEFWCLCVNEVYTVPPGKAWWRVVRLRLKAGAVGGDLRIAHDLIAGRPPAEAF